MAINDVVRFVIEGVDAVGSQIINVVDFFQSAGGGDITAGNIVGVIDVWAANFLPGLLACVGVDYTLAKIVCRGLSAGIITLLGESTTDAGSPGLASGVSGPVERCLLVKKLTGTGGRHGFGRIFVPMPPAENFFPDGLMDPGGIDVSAFFTFALNYPAAIAIGTPAVTLRPCVVNRATTAFLPVTGAVVNPLVGIQRRRRVGIGS